MAGDRRPARTGRTPRPALTRRGRLDWREHRRNTGPLLSARLEALGAPRVLSIFGGTTEIQKEIIARNLGL